MVYLVRRKKLGKTSCKAIAALSTKGIEVYRSDRPLPRGGGGEGDIIFRWGYMGKVPPGGKVINQAEAIALVADKRGFRLLLQEQDLCPDTWFERDAVKFPCVVRPATHHQGRNLWLCRTPEELKPVVDRLPSWYASTFIDNDAEFRVFIVSGLVVAVAQKFPQTPDAIAWNVFQGARFENVRWRGWPTDVIRAAQKAFNLSGLDFGGVDVMVKGEEEYVLEINA